MTQTINELISSAVQVLLFTLIPFIWWLITARKRENFFSWIGLKKPVGDKKKILLFILGAFVICEVVGMILNNTILKTDWNVSPFAGQGSGGLLAAISYSYLHTAFSEEILYRGFLQKRLQKALGFTAGTIVQAFIFGASHVILSYNLITFTEGVALLLYPMLPAILIAFINEKKCEGSIFPGWLIHGTLNVITHLSQLW
jgi:membrane protease YdiL (CAAX protease family)